MTAPARRSLTRRNVAITVALGAAATCLAVAAAQATPANSPDMRPPWVQPNGLVIEDLAPTAVPVVGPDGKQLIDSEGKPVTYDLRADLAREREVKPITDSDGRPEQLLEPGADSETSVGSPLPLSAIPR